MRATSKTWIETANSRVNALNEGIIDTTSVAVKSYKVGNQYRFFAHTFAIWAKGSFRNDVSGKVSNHVVFAVTFDGKDDEHYLDSEGIKQRIGDPYRAPRDGSANDDKSGKAVPVADIEVCTQKANNAYKSELAAIATLQKRFGKRIVSEVAELCGICVDNTANTMFAAAKEKERKAIAAKKETKDYAANVAGNKSMIDEIKAALAIEKAKEEKDLVKIMELTTKLLELL